MSVRVRTLARLLAIAAFVAFSFAAQAGDCTLNRRWSAEALEARSGGLLLPHYFAGAPSYFLLDTGSAFGTIFQDKINPSLPVMKSNMRLMGASGFSTDKVVWDFYHTDAPAPEPGTRKTHQAPGLFVVDRPPGADPREMGTTGTSFYEGEDLELDFEGRKVALYSPKHCPGQVVYWAPDYLVVPMKVDGNGRAIITVTLDGKQLRALIDTGATESVLSLDAADHFFDVTPDSPGVEKTSTTVDLKGKPLESYRRQFTRLDVGGVTFGNTWLQLTDMIPGMGADMILGMYHLRRMHLFLAFQEEKLYLTTAPPHPDAPIDPLGSVQWQRCLTQGRDGVAQAISGCGAIIDGAAEAPSHVAVAYAQRGAAYARKGDAASAGRDFDTALRMDPDLPDPRIIRAESFAELGDNGAALREFDIVLKSFPERIDALIGRAAAEIATGAYGPAAKDLRLAFDKNTSYGRTETGGNGMAKGLNDRLLALTADIAKAQPGQADLHILQADLFTAKADRDHAIAELDLAIAADPASAEAFLRRSKRYKERGDTDHALADLDQAVRLRPESTEMLNERCWVRAQDGRLDAALPDCEASMKLKPTLGGYQTRGFVHLKAGRAALAIADFTAALQLQPKSVFALYGRGQARKATGDAAGSAEDIAAAKQIQGNIDLVFGK